MNLTLDGFMCGPDDELDWHFQAWSGQMGQMLAEELSKADTILLGRITYCAMAAYWPKPANALSLSRDDLAFADMMNSYSKVVFSKTLKKTNWNNSRLIKGRLTQSVREKNERRKKHHYLREWPISWRISKRKFGRSISFLAASGCNRQRQIILYAFQ